MYKVFTLIMFNFAANDSLFNDCAILQFYFLQA